MSPDLQKQYEHADAYTMIEGLRGITMWKIGFSNGRRSPLVTGNAPVTDQVLQISQEK
jgi:hypothetical protein